MTLDDLHRRLERLLARGENEVVEFKRAGNDYSTDKIGRYLSALSNEANLHGADAAWLVFGVDDRTRAVVGTSHREEPSRLDALKLQMRENTEPSISFANIRVLDETEGRVILFEIPPAPRGLPISRS